MPRVNMAKKNKIRAAPVGVIRVSPKTSPKLKKVTKDISKLLRSLLKPSRLVPGFGTALAASDIFDVGSVLYNNRKELGTALSSPEGREKLMSLSKKGAKGLATDTLSFLKPPEWSKPYAKATKERMAKYNKPMYKTRKELLSRKKRGGKVGRPKGVGCAIKGYGKAMKRGK